MEPLLNSNIDLNCIMLNNFLLKDCISRKFSTRAFSWGTTLSPREKREDQNNPNCHSHGILNRKAMEIGDENHEEIIENVNKSSERCSVDDIDVLLDVDLVIASDVVYDPAGYEPLVKSLCDLLGGSYKLCKEIGGEQGGNGEGVGEGKINEDCNISMRERFNNSCGKIDSCDDISSSDGKINCSIINPILDITTDHSISSPTPSSSSSSSLSSSSSSSSSVPSSLSSASSYPLCILAHRHRHPENQR